MILIKLWINLPLHYFEINLFTQHYCPSFLTKTQVQILLNFKFFIWMKRSHRIETVKHQKDVTIIKTSVASLFSLTVIKEILQGRGGHPVPRYSQICGTVPLRTPARQAGASVRPTGLRLTTIYGSNCQLQTRWCTRRTKEWQLSFTETLNHRSEQDLNWFNDCNFHYRWNKMRMDPHEWHFFKVACFLN